MRRKGESGTRFKQFKLTLNRLLILLAVVGAGIGLLGGSAAQAAPVIHTARVASSTGLAAAAPDATSEDFNLSVVGGCGKWSGTLLGYVSGVKVPETYIELSGTLRSGCSGTSTGRFYYSCEGGTFYQPRGPWTTTSSTGTSYTAGPCSGAIRDMSNYAGRGRVELAAPAAEKSRQVQSYPR
jgi:hypothetical protein